MTAFGNALLRGDLVEAAKVKAENEQRRASFAARVEPYVKHRMRLLHGLTFGRGEGGRGVWSVSVYNGSVLETVRATIPPETDPYGGVAFGAVTEAIRMGLR